MAESILEVIFKGEDRGLKGMAQGLSKSITNVGKVALGIGAGGIIALGAAFSDATDLARIQINAEKQLDAVLASTGNAAGLTADEIKNMASELQNVTNFGDEAIISGQNLLLTFTNIGGDVFPRVTEAMLDMSQAFNQDMKSSAIQLGKALNDPVQGLTALSRVGVSFTDQQVEMIKAMAEAGDIAGAQAAILDELEVQFGGSAKAMADPAIQLSNAWGDFKEQVGSAILSAINPLAQRALPFLMQIMESAKPILDAFSTGVQVFITAISGGVGPIDAIKNAVGVFMIEMGLGGDIVQTVRDKIQLFFDKAKEIGGVISEAIQPITEWIGKNTELSDWLTTLAVVIGGVVLSAIVAVVAAMGPIILTIGAVVAAVALLRQAWETDFLSIRTTITAWAEEHGGIMEGIKAWWADLMVTWEQLSFIIGVGAEIIADWWGDLQTTWEQLKFIVNTGIEALKVAWANFKADIFTAVLAIMGIWEDLQATFNRVKNGIMAALQPIIDLINEVKTALAGMTLPDWMTPGSPTPWELGLKGVRDQMAALTRQELPGLQASLNGFNQGGGTTTTSTDNRQFVWNVNTAQFNPESAGRSAAAFALGGI